MNYWMDRHNLEIRNIHRQIDHNLVAVFPDVVIFLTNRDFVQEIRVTQVECIMSVLYCVLLE